MAVELASSIPKARQANKAEAADWFGVSIPTIDAWLRKRCPYVQRGEKGKPWILDLLAVALWKHGIGESEVEEDPEKMSPKDRLDWYKGTRERLVLEKERGNLIPADEVSAAWLNQITAAKGRLLSLPTRVAPDVIGISEPRDIERVLNAAISEALEELANG